MKGNHHETSDRENLRCIRSEVGITCCWISYASFELSRFHLIFSPAQAPGNVKVRC